MPSKIEGHASREPTRFLLVGVGPHAKRFYIPHLKSLEEDGRAKLVGAADIQEMRKQSLSTATRLSPGQNSFSSLSSLGLCQKVFRFPSQILLLALRLIVSLFR